MREGFTTGSCAAAAAKAAAYMLLTGNKIEYVEIRVPRGDLYRAKLEEVMSTSVKVSCAVRKNGGDDPDVTDGILIYAEARYGGPDSGAGMVPGSVNDERQGPEAQADPEAVSGVSVVIRGGEGIGIVTKPGLDQPVGQPAINSVPRRMIVSCVEEVCEAAGYDGIVDITISAPEGREIAKRTFNPRLGIEGGVSIIGTSGVVEPMSSRALKDTIRVEVRQRRELGHKGVVISPGNYGRAFLLERYGYDIDRAVKCGNFIGETVDMCVELGFEDMILAGHTGKLVKVSSGIMNTHSHEADGRMEAIAAAGIRAGLPEEVLLEILDSVSTTEALKCIKRHDERTGENGLVNVMSTIVQRVKFYLDFRAGEKMNIELSTYCSEIALVSETTHMRDLLEKISREDG